MNTLLSPVRPAKTGYEVSTTNVIIPDWTVDPRVRRLLASFRTSPAPMIDLPRNECWGTQTTAYTGFRVACLRVLRNAILAPALHAAWDHDDTDALDAIANAVTVDDAVAAASTIRIAPLHIITTTVRQLDPAVWGIAA